MTEGPRRKRFTVAEVGRLLDLGFFEGERYELVDGDLLVKHGQSPEHAFVLHRTWVMLGKLFPIDCVRSQMPIQAAGADAEHSLPEPDLAVVGEALPDYARRHPRGNELLLAIEVSDHTTIAFDRSRKAVLYAHAGVPEYWVLDLNRRALIAHSDTDGVEYRRVRINLSDGSVAFPGRSGSFKVAELIPPA